MTALQSPAHYKATAARGINLFIVDSSYMFKILQLLLILTI